MKICIFDTETTGLPVCKTFDEYYHYSRLEYYKNCRVLQLAWTIADIIDDKIVTCASYDYYIKYDGEIPTSSIEIHGITPEILNEKGLLLKDVLKVFESSVLDVELFIGHNINFDLNALQSEIFRLNLDLPESDKINIDLFCKNNYCTMKKAKLITKIRGKYNDYKYPRLSELYCFFFKNIPKNIHNASVDVKMCYECFAKMQNKILIN